MWSVDVVADRFVNGAVPELWPRTALSSVGGMRSEGLHPIGMMCFVYRTEIAGFMSEYGRPARRAARSLGLKTIACAAGGLRDRRMALRAVQIYIDGYSPRAA